MSKLLLSEESLTWASVREVFAPHVERQRNLSGASDVVGYEEEIFLGRDGHKRGGFLSISVDAELLSCESGITIGGWE